uniref:legumain n=1 Tax=Rhipicephalus zambeziensis TaxID=60191 RepID=A0A224YM96_9ACAR
MALLRCIFLGLATLAFTFAAVAKATFRAYNSDPKLWALLVATSNGYDNYRHQANIYHAYQVLHKHGIPNERIVVMVYDDIANSSSNPYRGVVVNRPSGADVYRGVPKDYTGDLVSPQNFLDILQGKKVKGGSGKVIASEATDHIFVNVVGLGAPGLIAFHNGTLHARPFVNVIKRMKTERKFAKMVIYVDASESGSMFDGLLPNDVNVYATTSANLHEPAYACYYDTYRKTFVGSVYSVNWMEHSDKKDLHRERLFDQFTMVRIETNSSHVMEFGDLSIGKLWVSEFQGAKKAIPVVLPKLAYDAVPSRDVPIAILRRKLAKAYNAHDKKSLKEKLRRALLNRSFLKKKVDEVVSFLAQDNPHDADLLLTTRRRLTNFDCYEKAVDHFSDQCFNLSKNPYALEHLRVLVNMCDSSYKLSQILEAMDVSCAHPTVVGIA